MIEELKDLNLIKKGGQKEVFQGTHDEHGQIVFKKGLAILSEKWNH